MVTTKGQIVIPSKVRQRLHIKKGTRLYLEEKDGEIIIRPATKEYFRRAAGILATGGKLSGLLLAERAEDWHRENKK